ncbi:glycosyltransferase family 2 protein [Azospirillum sp. ST 5-10]|uniref:glycosyltransferase family 2 protein n=1 Tax=unclassified Azospirillum TaxID=2630922 RepID=UPI003F4A5071
MLRVSVIVPAYRAEATIGRAVRSLLDQTWTDWEAVVVADDGADYAALLRAEGLDDPRLRFATTGRTGAGAPAARNAGLAAAAGVLVAPLDADDRYAPERLAALAPLAAGRGAAVDNVAVVRDADGAPLSTLFPPADGVAELDADGFLATSVPMFPVVRRDLCPTWSEDVAFCDDVVFNVHLLDRVGRLPLVRRPFYEYRQREGSITFAADAGERAERCYRHVLDRIAGDGLGIADPLLRRRFATAIERKRALNAAYEAAFRAGRCANFQEFLAQVRPPSGGA